MSRYAMPCLGLISLALALSGCGGGASHPGQVKGTLEMSDGRLVSYGSRPADLWMCTAVKDGWASIQMQGKDIDSYMHGGSVQTDGTLQVLARCDDLGEGGDEEMEFRVTKDQVYYVAASTPYGPETGRYTLTFSQEFGSIRAIQLQPGEVINDSPGARALADLRKERH